MGRPADAGLVWASVMDSAKTNDEQGTFWAPEDRSWLWYNDTIETHAFALRTLLELDPRNAKTDGIVQWLLLNKKLNQWKSTRATAEVIYSLVHYLKTRRRARDPRGRDGHRRDAEGHVHVRPGHVHREEQPRRHARRQDRSEDDLDGRRREGEQGLRVRLGRVALLDGEAPRRGSRRLLLGLAEVLPAREHGAGVRPDAARRGRRAPARATRSRCRSRSGRSTRPSTSTSGSARGRPRAGERGLTLEVGPRDRLVRGDARLGHELLLRASAGRASTRSSTGCARTWRGRSGSARRRSSRCTRPEFNAYSAGAVLTVAEGSPP